ncbi:uncharacterized protein VTP21DRAFT_911 [Calcarisporiella thermophila]|uniref:uncharacterized protein n=1 Tax=Calcarisporiella thermophila TaxID=911321 RepID=UPI00374257B5
MTLYLSMPLVYAFPIHTVGKRTCAPLESESNSRTSAARPMDFACIVSQFREALYRRSQRRFEGNGEEPFPISWTWVASKLLDLLLEYPSGLTKSIVLSELEVQWDEISVEYRRGVAKKFEAIDSLFEGNVSLEGSFEVSVNSVTEIPSTRTCLFMLCDEESRHTVGMYVHQKYYELLREEYRRLLFECHPPRTIRLTSTRLLTGTRIEPRLLPTEYLIFMLAKERDQAFIECELSKDRLVDIRQEDLQQGREYRFWLKITHIDSVQPALSQSHLRMVRIFVADMAGTDNAFFVLWDDQIKMVNLFKKGDYLGLYKPYIGPQYPSSGDEYEDATILEYGSATIVFCLPSMDSMLTLSSQSQRDGTEPVPRDDQGYMDCKLYAERILIKNLKPKMLNVTLFGRIIAMAANNPMVRDGACMDRFAIKLQDESGSGDVTLWQSAGHEISSFRVGQYVLLENLTTSTSQRSDGTKRLWYVNGSPLSGTRIRCVSSPKAIIASSFLREVLPLAEAGEHDWITARVLVIGWHIGPKETLPPTDGIEEDGLTHEAKLKGDLEGVQVVERAVQNCHLRCKHALELRTPNELEPPFFFCSHCQLNIRPDSAEEMEPRFKVWWCLEDSSERSSRRVWAKAGIGVADDMVGLSAQSFQLLPLRQRLARLDAVIGKEYWIGLVALSLDSSGSHLFRIDSCLPVGKPRAENIADELDSFIDG